MQTIKMIKYLLAHLEIYLFYLLDAPKLTTRNIGIYEKTRKSCMAPLFQYEILTDTVDYNIY